VTARAETGYADWHSWSCATWGTKWNAYRCSVGSDEDGSLSFAFFTAWEFPEPVFVALAAAFPELVFQCACFEDAGDFAGQGEFNGASDFALCGVTAEIYELVLGDGRMRAA